MLNRHEIIGRLGKDPETKQTQSGNTVATFSVATTETYKDKSGEKKTETSWHNIVVWGKLAEICGKYLAKGSLVYLAGASKSRSWENDGKKFYTTELIANEMKMLGSKGDGEKPQTAASAPEQKEPEWLSAEPLDDLPFAITLLLTCFLPLF